MQTPPSKERNKNSLVFCPRDPSFEMTIIPVMLCVYTYIFLPLNLVTYSWEFIQQK